jgi:hypothetical protein
MVTRIPRNREIAIVLSGSWLVLFYYFFVVTQEWIGGTLAGWTVRLRA